jgi:heme/copper-type cytochrome/quinol oxidase subunit 3
MARRDPTVLDVSDLPDYGFGSHGVVWWGVLGFVAIEATMLGLCIATYFYLRTQAVEWPPGNKLPGMTLPTITTAVLLASIAPMIWTERAALARDARGVQVGLLICLAFGFAFIILRAIEFGLLDVWWNDNAYGSIVWVTLGLHTTHMLAEVAETVVIAVLMFRPRPIHPKYLSDVEDNALYWYFIVGIWVPVYAVLFVFPRLT